MIFLKSQWVLMFGCLCCWKSCNGKDIADHARSEKIVVDDINSLTFNDVLLASKQIRKEEYWAVKEFHMRMGAAHDKWWSKPFVADLDHNPDKFPRCGNQLVSLFCHGDHFNFDKNRSLVAEEHLQAQLFNALPEVTGPANVSTPFPQCQRMLTIANMKKGAGHSMHVRTAGEWVLWNLSRLRPKYGMIQSL